MGGKKKYWVSIAVMLLLAGLTYGILFSKYDLAQCFGIIRRASPVFLVLALLASAGYILGEAAVLCLCIRALGRPMAFGRAVEYAMVGVYFSDITPSAGGGQPAQAYYMSKEGYSVAESAISLLLMSIMFKVVLLVPGLPLVWFEARQYFMEVPYFNLWLILGVVMLVLATVLLVFIMFSKTLIYRGMRWCVRVLAWLRLVRDPEKKIEKLARLVETYREAAQFIRCNPMLSAKVFGITLVQRTLLFSVAWCVYRALGLSGLSWLDIVAIQAGLSILVDQLPFPGAVGVSEGVFLKLYGSIYGAQLLVPAMVLTRGINYYLPMMVSGAVTGIFHLRMLGRRPRLELAKRIVRVARRDGKKES